MSTGNAPPAGPARFFDPASLCVEYPVFAVDGGPFCRSIESGPPDGGFLNIFSDPEPISQEKVLYYIYQIVIGIVFYLCFPFLLLLVLITGRHREGLRERLGCIGRIEGRRQDQLRLWLHAASVGEVRAAGAVMEVLRRRLPQARFFLSTMTIHGRRVAREQLPSDVTCFLAPLDVPLVVDRILAAVDPDLYICIETEIWPLLIHKVAARGAGPVLINGRMSEKSFHQYMKIRRLIAGVLKKFKYITVIGEADCNRYAAVGADGQSLSITGNAKYDLVLPEDIDGLKSHFRSMLKLDESDEVLICGSTHTGEETLLLSLYRDLQTKGELLWLLAPRHLDRLASIEEMLKQEGLAFNRFSELRGGKARDSRVVVIDTLGELAGLYSVATYVFCGGSLVDRGGHNVMEAAVWGKPVFYGPSMGDFKDAAELLESVRAGFQVNTITEIIERIRFFRNNPAEYEQACQRAYDIAGRQIGAAGRQAEIVLRCLGAGSG